METPSENTQPPQESTPNPEAPPESRGFQQRIDQLVGQRGDAQRGEAEAKAEVAELRDRLGALEQTSAPSPSPTGEKTPSSIEQAVANALKAQLAPVLEQTQQDQLFKQQEAAFMEASQDLPALRVANSPERQLFNQLFEAREDLRDSPDGPALLVQVVKGIFAGGVPDGLLDEARKIAASPPSATGTPNQRIAALPQENNGNRERIAELSQKAKVTGRLTQSEQKELFHRKISG